MRRIIGLAAGWIVLVAPLPCTGAESKWAPFYEVRLRAELTDSPSARPELEQSCSLGLLRIRAGADFQWTERLSVHGVLQASAMTTLPARPAFGAGATYRATNADDRTPEQLGVAELSLRYRTPTVNWAIGRQGFAEGAGQSTGMAEPDFIRTRKLGERLVGNLDFPNVGRRFEGGTLSARYRDRGTLELFALRPLSGSFHYDDAFEPLDISLYGGSWSTGLGEWVPHTSVRLFAMIYDDARDVAATALGGPVEIDTVGVSLLAGDPNWSLLGWLAIQRGDMGRREQKASAWILDVGYRFSELYGSPAIHLGYEWASGDRGGDVDRGFFNLLPTNHKFYGAIDYSAFSNLSDLALEGRWAPGGKWSLVGTVHDFRLVESRGAWVGGSGAFSERELGYVYRRPGDGDFRSRDLGREVDLSAAIQLHAKVALKIEAGIFLAGAAAEQILRLEGDGSWLSLELSLRN